jgi:uncharacterized protein
MRIVISGATGLIGTALAASLDRDGIEVTRLVRRSPASPAEVSWDPRATAGRLDPAVLSGADAVVHLSGAPVGGGRWTQDRKRQLRGSRIASTNAIVAAIEAAPQPPPVLVCASAIGWYGDTGDRAVTESAPAGTGFLPTLVRDWEAAAATAPVRVVNLRSGLVMSGRGGLLSPLLPLFRLGLGARLGSGRQYLSWIAKTDEVRAIRFLLDHPEVSGPVNLTAPAPVTNAEFTAALARAVHRPAVLTVPAVALRAALGEASGELLNSCRVLPGKLEQAGFSFRFPDLAGALAFELNGQTRAA